MGTGLLVVAAVFGIWAVAEWFWIRRLGQPTPRAFYLTRGVTSTIALMLWAATVVLRQRRAYERRREEEVAERYRELLHGTVDGVVMMGEDSIITYMNQSARTMFGWFGDDAIGRDVSILIPEPHRSRHAEYVSNYLRTGRAKVLGVSPREVEGVRRDGTVIPLELLVTEARLMGRRVFIAFARDLTDRRVREEQMMALKARAEEERERRSRLESLGTLAGGIAHDFNNYLQAILGNLSIAERQTAAGSELKEVIVEARQASQQAAGLAQQLLTFAKGGTPIKKRVDLAPLIEGTVRLTLRGKPVRLEMDMAPNLAPVEVDAGQIGQVIQNIVLNAVQAMPDGGRLGVRAANADVRGEEVPPLPPGPYVKLCLEDTGTGIRPDHLSRMFDPYFTTKAAGNGLGLASAFSIVRKHGGTIGVDSTWGKGTSVSVYLPAAA